MLSRRLFSTSRQVSKAQITKLANGLTIASKPGNFKTSSIGLYSASGSRSENSFNSGVSTLIGTVLSESKQSKESYALSGVKVTSSNQKEITGLIQASFASGNKSEALSTITKLTNELDSIISNESLVKEWALNSSLLSEKFESNPKSMSIEHMISTAFQGTSLALPTYGKADTISTLESMDLKSFLKKQFVASNLAIVSTGNEISHDELVSFASKLSIPSGSKPSVQPFHFLGSEVRLRDDTLPQAHVAISASVPSVTSPDYITGLVAAQVNGSYLGSLSPFTQFEGSQLSQFLTANHLCDEYEHFNFGYSDTGLWGAYLASHNIANFDETVHFTLKSWNRLSVGTVTEVEFEKAKSELKLKLLSTAPTSTLESDKLAFDALIKGYSESDAELISLIDDVSIKKITKWAQTYLWDQDIAMAGTGQIEALFDYNRIRNDMSMMRW
ncbi:hypothetical protein CANARDRAFT_27820 [[Candida] arabinofermentans NRRL YB-2248]|uniref:Peptidase M16 C-terminal domain-containing protein n=1 Tax=[Candida] arabinofermentans NRRL YB-2248 TaxID=983967 RepID=A0A1E4T1W7_9ASCO|nr:hypothetical protein CANARDRAFT_27820 [[Candida] arabinofermentans NRRL YB-2248]